MCGRFTLRTNPAALAEVFGCEVPPNLTLRYNIAPTQPVAVVRTGAAGGQREFVQLHWGLIPSWATDAGIGSRMINARAETVAEKTAFRAAFRRRRCLVPADGYFEWQKTGKAKQPFYIQMADQRPFAFAGLWERWSPEAAKVPNESDTTTNPRSLLAGPGPAVLDSCTIITTAANEGMRPIHDRMPVILPPAAWDEWLAVRPEATERLQEMLRPYAGDDLIARAVESYVNNPRNEGPRCIAVARRLL